MRKVLFLGMPAFGHINPTLGIVTELVKNGDEVVYFNSEEFREVIESTGAVFKSYGEWSNRINILLKSIREDKKANMDNIRLEGEISKVFVGSCEETVEHILEQIKDIKFDCIGYASVFPYGNIVGQILRVPSFSSCAIFANRNDMSTEKNNNENKEKAENRTNPIAEAYNEISDRLNKKYDIQMPALSNLFFNRGDINFAYTSKYFVAGLESYDDSFKFIGPPIYSKEEDVRDFPYKEIQGKKVIYISLGTIYSNFDKRLYGTFFNAFKDEDVVVVMTAYKVDLSEYEIPKNFIVKNYISQTEILKYADVAVTHGGMNSTNDLLYNNIPFVAIPLGADQPFMASRVSELGACISLDKDKLTPELLKDSVNKVLTESQYLENIKKINKSFRESGGYKRALEEILELKKLI